MIKISHQVDVVTLGETMLMLSPSPTETLEDCDTFNVLLGGSESNTAVGLQRLGIDTGWISKLVDNQLGRKIKNQLRTYGVDTSRIVWTDKKRVGLFFVELGLEPRPLKTIYDREDAAVTTLKTSEIDWDYFEMAKWVHLSGITPALSSQCKKTISEVIDKANSMDLTISFDVNYRSLLWSPEEAKRTLDELIPRVDILISTLEDGKLLLESDDIGAEETANKLQEKYGNGTVVVTLGDEGSLALDEEIFYGPAFSLEKVNRLGSGDAFDAGFIHGYLKNGTELGLKYGGSMAVLTHTISSNMPIVSKDDVESLISGEIDKVLR